MSMSTKKPTPSDEFLDALTDELIAMPDDDVLEGCQASAVQARGLERLRFAKAEAGRRRMATAKSRVTSSREQGSVVPLGTVSVETARKYLADASNDVRYTLAARNLNEMSVEDILRLYAQMKRLEDAQGKSET